MHVCLYIKSNILLAWLFGTNCYLLGKRRRKWKVLFYLPFSSPVLILSLHCSTFLTHIIFLLFTELLGAFLERQVYQPRIPSVFVCLRKPLFLLHFWRITSLDTEFRFSSFSAKYFTLLCWLLAYLVSEEKSDVMMQFLLFFLCR